MGATKRVRKRRYKPRRRSRYRKRGGAVGTKHLAILFYGRISSYEHSLEYINSIYKNPRFNCVVFCSLNLKNKSQYITDFCKEFNIADEQINIEPTEYPAAYKDNVHNKTFCETPTSCINTYSMYYHQHKAFKLMEGYEKRHSTAFDIVVMFRPDMNAKDAPNVFPIEETIAPNTIYVPRPVGATEIGPNGLTPEECEEQHGSDFYRNGLTTLAAYGNKEAMKKYTSLIEQGNPELDHPEVLLFEHVEKMGLKLHRFDHNIVLNPERKDAKYPTE